MEEFARLSDLSQDMLFANFVVFLRVGAAMAILPAFGERSIPERVRLLLALAFTVAVAPAVLHHTATLTRAGATVGTYIFTEVISGLLLGLLLRLFVMVLQMAGSIAAQSTSLSQLFGGGAVDAQPAIGHLFLISGLALATMMGLHVRIAEALILSYEVLPVGAFPDPMDISALGMQTISKCFSLAFTLSAPFVVASLIYNVALGVINRAMPQLMVAMVGAPAITWGSLMLMFVAVPILLGIWSSSFDLFLSNPFAGP
ncbi:flagellar biosynthesis protein FliR [Aquimixticola soesokkakensis]|uniref:Flagellar biosynthesis protein FliR n=1 Tax=Aquimixticola soesokkakensis TaxID=1519096 RepID=A0A1Y5RC01_9RHOB|nr:flagellar biosynthetic protein FliR [Aquimixticola soesokkakensis]SLN13089.1 flagellar biosynthesis protein FliR [Aquimixticola soesokkakensis]